MASDYQEIKQKTIGLKYAINGLIFAFKNEINMRVHVLVTIIVIMLGFFFQVSFTEWVLLFLTFGLVLSSEVFNTAVEMLLDYLAPEWHPKAGIIKDLTAGGVLIASSIALIIGAIIFIPKIITWMM
ncbi:diacylglycerol kinase [Halolactibacillus alkaliphilus]|uniref:Diacylglycerol kinase n=1 Tax=Halolactibacillus alkaliphilus TaxID=442899 RepID=A0A511X3B2_9BACI|nr:diacylglycerol kinase family protein [Halolactibacillus alkaliphilus]GEN57411.1 diacylglycerol kinase [Halolactibacillus alkaliphilus]GGN69110.1 diacylglycerol kinase [Halolactibacillus alkaliphilus]SFO73772.1 diacylglycerol kinase (ATP) [Halolactibacillus alkaliphilus]